MSLNGQRLYLMCRLTFDPHLVIRVAQIQVIVAFLELNHIDTKSGWCYFKLQPKPKGLCTGQKCLMMFLNFDIQCTEEDVEHSLL
jgi:hypothetical protein